MMIAIALVSMAIGCFVGYKVGYSRCNYQFKKALQAVKVWSQKEFGKNKRKEDQ